jgi:protocatechuate 3,4-dioxygenase beta subunit
MQPGPLRPRDWSSQPPQVYPEYKSTPLRSITKPLIPLKQTLSELSGPVYGHDSLGALDADLTRNAVRPGGVPIGERIVVTGRVLDEDGRPVRGSLIEIWQTNAAGRYMHTADQHDAPLDPNFFGGGRCITDGEGRYRFLSVRPGAYPWGNHHNAWRPAHIHFSLLGPTIANRLITQMYFPGDPMLAYDPIYKSTPEKARDRLVANFSIDVTEPGYALGYVFDIVLRGRLETPMEAPHA